MARSDARYRLFIALYPPHQMVSEWLREIKPCLTSPHRRVEKHQIHLTLSFLGEVRVSDIIMLKQDLNAICSAYSPFDIQTLNYWFLPSLKSPRLLALNCRLNRQLAALHYQCERISGEHEKTKKPFLPHITLCRFKQKKFTPQAPDHQPQQFKAEQIKLMRSELDQHGAVHHCLETFRLGAQAFNASC